jgi:hypothetical protein
MATSYAIDIRPLFRDKDIRAMKTFGHFDLSLYDDVNTHASAIYERLANGSMPCDQPWPEAQVQLFQKWMNEGKQP